MNIARKIASQIKRFPFGKSFGYKDLNITKDQYVTAAKALERLQKKGVIKKVANGKFYKPEETIFGELRPSEYELLKPYLFEGNKRIAYITGASLYNGMGLTTQVAARIKIASRGRRIYVQAGNIKATPAKSYVEVTNDNYIQLGFLDALKDINRVSDLNPKSGVIILSNILKEMSDKTLKETIKYAMAYPPRARALLGALLENMGKNESIGKLKDSLNPFSEYKVVISKELPTAKNWNLI
ncbi:DUF6088 family protein [Bizionia arctica]|uniref:Transcriptional regulator, AbiEi antitoxin, Type IV TA system n=1 Tax=Bizionia arctica TaxID=1495645 RepID=A0A917GDN4_9FLAO|nr:DUF6088 family protein [Bizionia arctica]GGG40592.1 hypothetical protein GCM10010976_10280 [Bizionia arctica]